MARPSEFRQGEIHLVVQRCKSGQFVGKFVAIAAAPDAFQADDEGSIPFTRSNLFKHLVPRNGPA
jgi:hypothetical protein